QFFQFSFVNSLVIKHLDPSKWLDKSKVNRGVRSQESGVRSQLLFILAAPALPNSSSPNLKEGVGCGV
ncbi:MAG: hypothetical protein ACKPKF_12425, partial [Microcystis panniformis]